MGKTTWNYRVIRQEEDGASTFAIHEVYYEGKKVVTWTESPVAPSGNTRPELLSDLQMMGAALGRPVLVLEELERRRGKD